MLKLNCRQLAFASYKVFSKNEKRGLELVSLPHFLHDILPKYLLLHSIN